jgi:uncharacterized membrane protein YhaH (DUF805 family)
MRALLPGLVQSLSLLVLPYGAPVAARPRRHSSLYLARFAGIYTMCDLRPPLITVEGERACPRSHHLLMEHMMITSAEQPSLAVNPPIHPSRRLYWIAGGILAAAVICIALAVAGLFSLNRQIKDFQRVPVPGQAEVTFTQPGGYVLYLEKPGQCCSASIGSSESPPFPSWSMRIALVGGTPVAISAFRDASETYGVTGHQGQAAMYFTISQPGRYLLTTGDVTPGSIADIAVGRGIGPGIVIPVISLLAGLLALVGALALGGVTVFQRRRARRNPGLYGPVGHDVRSYLQGGPVGFGEAIKQGFRNGFVYRGRASLSAYWWFFLFLVIVSVVLTSIFIAITSAPSVSLVLLIAIVSLYLSLVSLALVVRRLHDIDKSGWWVLINLVPFVGPIILLVFTLLEGTHGLNNFEPAADHRR